MNRTTKLMAAALWGLILTCGNASCSVDALLQATASLGGDLTSGRGNTEVVFINNTPYRAIFTFGDYDNLDRDTVPNLLQFSSDSDTLSLEGNSETSIELVRCARVYAIGTPGLIARVRANVNEDDFEEAALVPGVYFSDEDTDHEFADAPTRGRAAPHEAFIGSNFECGAMLIYRFEFNDAGPEEFVVEMTVIPSDSTRG
jgi:hypothetical protein